jgi:dTDP-4-amino-4,6-dideoxygalactose transaminase
VKPINVTETYTPPIERYSQYLEKALSKKWLTNRGALTLDLEKRITEQFDLDHLTLMTNGTLPIQIALKVLGKGGEIITTPFSYIATSAAIVWENCTPVFVDIDPVYWTIDETQIEAAITDKTTAILATHVFGNPCNTEIIEQIARKHKIHVIYDNAHGFGVQYKGKSLFKYGDVCTCSFHATKIFHTGEGGAAHTSDRELHEQIYHAHNFGHNGPEDFHGLGINAKISELQSAMGHAVLDDFEQILTTRRKACEFYFNALRDKEVYTIQLRPETNWNYSYFPILFKEEGDLLIARESLNKENIYPRRYFYPSLNTIKYLNGPTMPVAENIASRILCLPLSSYITEKDLQRIVSHIR